MVCVPRMRAPVVLLVRALGEHEGMVPVGLTLRPVDLCLMALLFHARGFHVRRERVQVLVVRLEMLLVDLVARGSVFCPLELIVPAGESSARARARSTNCMARKRVRANCKSPGAN